MPKIVMSQGEIMEVLRVSRTTVRKYQTYGLPMISRGKYDAAAVVSWFVEFSKKKSFESTGAESQESNVDKRLTIARAEKVERENAAAKNELIKREDVEAFATAAGTMVNNAFESLGARISNQLAGMDDPAEIQQLVWAESRDLLGAISEKAESISIEMTEDA